MKNGKRLLILLFLVCIGGVWINPFREIRLPVPSSCVPADLCPPFAPRAALEAACTAASIDSHSLPMSLQPQGFPPFAALLPAGAILDEVVLFPDALILTYRSGEFICMDGYYSDMTALRSARHMETGAQYEISADSPLIYRLIPLPRGLWRMLPTVFLAALLIRPLSRWLAAKSSA